MKLENLQFYNELVFELAISIFTRAEKLVGI